MYILFCAFLGVFFTANYNEYQNTGSITIDNFDFFMMVAMFFIFFLFRKE